MTSSIMDFIEDDVVPKKCSDFSIDHILNKAGNSRQSVDGEEELSDRLRNLDDNVGVMGYGNFGYEVPFTWLQCSRYCPPKVPRKREGPQRRQLGRHPRIPFTSQQLSILEDKFKVTPYLSSEEVTKLSRILDLADIRVKIWFQNRRARERRERQQLEQQLSPRAEIQQSLINNVSVQNQSQQNFDLSNNILNIKEQHHL